MSQKKNKHESSSLHGNGGKKHNKNFNEDSKLRANVVSKLCDNFQDNFDRALITSVAHTCQWDIIRATEALILLSGGKKNVKKKKNSKGSEKDLSKNKAKSLPGTLKQEKYKNEKRVGSASPLHYSSTNSLSSSQVWQRHYKSKPQSPGLLTMIPPHNKEITKQKKPQTFPIVPKPKSPKEMTTKQKRSAEVKKIEAEVKKLWQLINNGVKVMIIMRGPPGSGKTHFAQCIVAFVTRNEMSQHILSTDDYFIMLGRGNYAYDYSQLPQAHSWNQKRVSEALKRGINPIVVDNTNIQAWEMQPYVCMGVEHNYVIEVLEPVTEWKFKEAELARRNIHSVPREKIRQMLEKYEPGWTGEKLLKSFGLKYKNSGSTEVTQEKRLPINSLLAQHRQNAVVAPEKPKRKKNASKKKNRQNLAGIEITEEKEKQLEELKNLFAEYGKQMNSSTKQKVLESGVSIAEVVSRMRKLQGNVLPLPNQSILSIVPETNQLKNAFDIKATESVPKFSSPRKNSFSEELAETDTMSSSNASETSECETDTENELPKWKEMRKYFESGNFVDGEDLCEDYDDENNENRPMKETEIAGGTTLRSQISSSQEELSLIDFDTQEELPLIDFGTCSIPASYSPDNLSLLDYAEMENQNRKSSSSSEEQKTQKLSLQESLREVLIDSRLSEDSNRMILNNTKEELKSENGVTTSENIKQSTVEVSDSLRDAMGRRFERTENKCENDEDIPICGVSINESLLHMLVKKYNCEEIQEKTENSTSETSTKDFQCKKSPDLEEVPLPSIPQKQKNLDNYPATASNIDWCGTKTDKFEDIINSWEHPRAVETKPDDSPKQARPKNALLGAIKKTTVQPREKSPEELLRSADLGWSSISFDSWEDLKKKPSEFESVNCPKTQRKSVLKTDSSTNTFLTDFNLWKEEGGGTLKLNTQSRNINLNYKEPSIPINFKSDILMLDKSSMTVDAEELEFIPKDSGVETLSGMFPDISKEYLNDVFEKCKGNILWAIEVLLETPQNLAKISEPPQTEANPPSYNEAKAMGDLELAPFQNLVIADGKKTIKRKKDKKNLVSELSLILKKQIEESIQINENLYQDKTLFLKKLRHGEIEFSDEPILPVPTIPDNETEKFANLVKNEEKEEDEEEMIPMKIDPEFFNILTRQFGIPDSSSNEEQIASTPIINIPISLAQQIYDCWLDTMNKQLEEMQSTYDKMVKEDELLAAALQEQEFEYRQPDLREIMDMELAMLLYKQNQAQLLENRETLANKLSKQLLFEAYPNMDKKMLLDLFESEGRSFKKVVDVLEAQENKTPITVIAPEFLANHGNKLMEQAKSENLFKEKTELLAKKTIIVLKENKTQKNSDENNILVVNPAGYRQKITLLQQQRNDCCRQAQEAFRKKSFSVASYFSHMAGLYKERIKDLEKELFQSSAFEEKRKSDSTKIDLHFLTVKEALLIVDHFIDHHINRLRKRNELTVSLHMITGRGKHSDQGKSKLKPAVEGRLKQRDLNFCRVNEGMLNVTLHKKDLLLEEM